MKVLFWLLIIVGCVVFAAFTRALTARLVTGKWPHQSEAAQRIYRDLP